MLRRLALAAACAPALFLRAIAFAADASLPGKLVIEEPTFVSLGVEWFIDGDDNGNAAVALEYRKTGDGGWRAAMPLWRVDSTGRIRKVPAGQTLFAGSIFNLDQGAAYEMKLTLADPDGGGAEKIVTATTRVEPVLPADGRARYVVPGDGGGTGTKDDPLKGLAAADAAAKPGDVMHLAPGMYKGTWKVTASGAEGRPVVWLGPSNNSAVIDGGGAERAISADGLSNVWFWHLTVTNAEFAVVTQRSSYMVMRYCRVSRTDNGYTANENPMKGNVLLDNVFAGWVPWFVDGKRTCYPDTVFRYNGRRYDVTDILGVNVSGEGTVVAFNRMKDWGDAVHGSGDQPKCANDFYNNEISECGDDGIECDEGAQNIRCFSNRITNCFQGISAQPVHGGPCYIFRNALYNINDNPFKLQNRPHGVLLINNTSVRPATDPGPLPIYEEGAVYCVLAQNNLFVGGGSRCALDVSPRMEQASFDYNGYAGGPWKEFARWNGRSYLSLKDFQDQSGQEKHALVLPVKGLFASGVMLPESADKIVDLAANDLRLAGGAAAVDAGSVFPGITDGFAGKAPDLGAYELGSALPHYGPRPEK
jgi:hypothetical protein